MTTDAKITIEHNGHTATIEWRRGGERWRPAWWLSIAGGEFPFGSETLSESDAAALIREKYIGEPPPSDHASIWGGYTCSGCGAKGVRLWRDYQTFWGYTSVPLAAVDWWKALPESEGE